MGLLSSAWNVIDPFVPDEPVMGLLGRLRGGMPPSGPQAPWQTQQGPPQQRQGPGLGELASRFIFKGEVPSDVRAEHARQTGLRNMGQNIRATVSDPREQLAALLNPEEWSKNVNTRYGAHNVAGGNALVMGEPGRAGSSIYNAPKYGESEGRAYAITPDSVTQLGELAPSYGQETDRLKAKADASGYTLGPGMTRYGPNNEVLAAAPFAPQYREVGAGESLVAVGGDERMAPPSYQQVAEAITSAIPGARVTSGFRTPEENARVDGVPNSQHMSGTALDLVPPEGVSMEQFAQQIRATAPAGTEIIPEGNHVHIEWGGKQGGGVGARVLARGEPKPDMTPKQVADVEFKVRSQFNGEPDVKDYNAVATSYEQVKRLASKDRPSPGDDMALVYSFMKMLDPGSVVRESEYGMVAKTAGLPDQVVMGIQGLTQGKGLTPQIRRQLIGAADAVLASRQQRYDALAEQYIDSATRMGAPEAIRPRPRADQTQPRGGEARQEGQFSPAQQAKANELLRANPRMRSAPVGSKARPYAPRTEAEFKSIKPGQFYIDDDGQIYQKGR